VTVLQKSELPATAPSSPRTAAPRARAPRPKGELFGADQLVYRAVLDAVMAQRLPPGTRLIEASLSNALGVSRAVVRMGLLRLAHDRIVELRPNRGAAIARPDFAEARQVYEARRLLEGALAEQMCTRLSRTGIAELRRIVMAGTAAFRRHDNPGWITLAGRFHTRLAELSGNPVIAGQVTELVSRTNLITALYLTEGETVYTGDERLQLLELFASGTPAAARRARKLMEGMLEAVEKRLKVSPPMVAGIDLESLLGPARSRP
jgi:DNA-binding GntR family transcriptional regulator